MRFGVSACALLGLLVSRSALGQTATTAGEAKAPYPTLENISLEWAVSGDSDNDGVVKVRYRKTGSTTWLDALPLVRVPAGSNQGFSWTNRHAGSVSGRWWGDQDPERDYAQDAGRSRERQLQERHPLELRIRRQ